MCRNVLWNKPVIWGFINKTDSTWFPATPCYLNKRAEVNKLNSTAHSVFVCFWDLRLSYSCSQVCLFFLSAFVLIAVWPWKKKKNMQTNIPLNHKLLFCILLAIIPLFKLYYSLQSGHAVWNEALCQIKGSYSEKRPFTTEGSELKQTRNPSSRVLMLRSVRKGCCKSQFQPLQHTQRSLSLSPVVRTPYGKPLSI